MTTQTTAPHRPTWIRRGATLTATVSCALALTLGVAATASAAPVRPTHLPSATAAVPAGGATVTAISPTVQAGLASQEVDITGTGFTGASKVTFGGVPAHAMSVISDTEIAAVAPAHANGAVDLVITTPDGIATLPNGYTYTDATSQNFEQDVNVPGLSGTIAVVQCPTETPYLTNAGSDEVIGFTDYTVPGVTEWENPHYSVDADGQARGVVVHYGNANVNSDTVMPEVHCTSSKNFGFSTKLTPGQRIAGPAAPSPSSSPNAMDQLLPALINDSNSDLKITKVWTSGVFDDSTPFIDGDAPQAGQVIAAGSQLTENLRFTGDSRSLHVRVTDDHGDVFETSVSGSSLTSGLKQSWSCKNTAGSNLQCHSASAHTTDSTIVKIENA